MTRIAPRWLVEPRTRRVMDALAEARPLFVGGCVRDALLGVEAEDVDICVAAPPDRALALLEAAGLKTAPTGLDHGVVMAVADGRAFEVASLRRDVVTDGRRAVVDYTQEVAEDAARRDFTLNALYADAQGAVLDPLGGGRADLAAGRVSFVGEATTRIREDYLRILRFFRFSARFAESFDPDGLASCLALRAGLDRLSRERVGMEMRRILALPRAPQALAAMGPILPQLLPGAETELLAALAAREPQPDWLRRLAALGAADPATALRLSKAQGGHLDAIAAARAAARPPAQAAYLFGSDPARDAALIAAAEAGAAAPKTLEAELARGAAARCPVGANDLIAAGWTPGPELGAALKRLEALWVDADFTPDAQSLLRKL